MRKGDVVTEPTKRGHKAVKHRERTDFSEEHYEKYHRALDVVNRLKARKDVDGLIQALNDESWFVRRAAVRALGDIGDAKAVGPLGCLAKTPVENEDMSASVVEEMLGQDREPLTILIIDGEIVPVPVDCAMLAMCALAKINDKAAVAKLIEVFNSLVSRFDETSKSGDFSDYLHFGGDDRILVVARALAETGDRTALEALAEFAITHKLESQRLVEGDFAAWALSGMGNQRLVELLIDQLRTGKGESTYWWAVGVLPVMGEGALEPLFQAFSEGEDDLCRAGSAVALVRMEDGRGIEYLIGIIKEGELSKVEKAAKALLLIPKNALRVEVDVMFPPVRGRRLVDTVPEAMESLLQIAHDEELDISRRRWAQVAVQIITKYLIETANDEKLDMSQRVQAQKIVMRFHGATTQKSGK